ncbi:hypothetical protein K493DRAFT_301525 [Basidiobolus meristosporus CBS 931.73]|uniref:Uncharacterized protein n=1 Tax=Basidiobolus meristosporus CBS 931.73 TaxID=1314790 RepID=A0A1Y1YBN1_9FUNG|nr:hypothetical protein K493DRAFT_301525 [Basidiobolus meristosporus CBS 931.73]|eukprot:ORX95325.1 hypothetical protein K493DRAFT_301525 [Basidiobolus meristosporus CBS 931.73]
MRLLSIHSKINHVYGLVLDELQSLLVISHGASPPMTSTHYSGSSADEECIFIKSVTLSNEIASGKMLHARRPSRELPEVLRPDATICSDNNMQSTEKIVSAEASLIDSSIGRGNIVSVSNGMEIASSPVDYQKILASKEMIQDALVGSLIGVSATLRYEAGTRFSHNISAYQDPFASDELWQGQAITFTTYAGDHLQSLAMGSTKEKSAQNGPLLYKNPYHLDRLGGQLSTTDLSATPTTFSRTTSWLMSRLSATNILHVVKTPKRPKPTPFHNQVHVNPAANDLNSSFWINHQSSSTTISPENEAERVSQDPS